MKLLAPRDAAAALNISVSRLQQLNREGRIQALRDSAGRRLFREADVRAYEQRANRARQQSRSVLPSE